MYMLEPSSQLLKIIVHTFNITDKIWEQGTHCDDWTDKWKYPQAFLEAPHVQWLVPIKSGPEGEPAECATE